MKIYSILYVYIKNKVYRSISQLHSDSKRESTANVFIEKSSYFYLII